MNKTLTILVSIMVAGVVVGASLPIFDSLTASSESVHNDGAGWVRFALDRNAGTTYSLSYTSDDDGFYIDNGTDRQTYDDSSTVNFDTILYADSNLSVWVDGAIHILGTNEGNPFYLEGSGDFTIVRDADGVTVTPDGADPLTFGVPTWSYIPVSTGNYGFFLAADFDSDLGNGVKNYPSDMPLAVVGGGFAGVYAYNDIYRYNGLGLNMHPVYDDDGLFYGAYWDQTASVEPESLTPDVFDPAIIDLDPIDIDLDPIVLDPGAQLLALPTPTYTDGDWGYDLMDVDGVSKAKIVSYSGTGGNLVIPATVGGYDVYQIGNGSSAFLDNSTLSNNSTLTITPGPVVIGKHAFDNITKLVGDLVIPEGITTLEQQAFIGCNRFTSLTLPSTLTTLGTEVFYYASGLVSFSGIPEGLTTIPQSTFNGCSHLTGELVIPDTITTIGQSAFSDCDFYGPLVIPDSVTSIGSSAFNLNRFDGTLYIGENITRLNASYKYNSFTGLIINSDLTPNNASAFDIGTQLTEVLDLSDTIDYSVNRYGIPAAATVSDSIGDCFGFVSIVDLSGSGGSPTQTLIAMLPLIMVLGLVLMAVGIFIWNRM